MADYVAGSVVVGWSEHGSVVLSTSPGSNSNARNTSLKGLFPSIVISKVMKSPAGISCLSTSTPTTPW